MITKIVKMDQNGRIYIPSNLRKKLRSKQFYIMEEDGKVILIPVREKLLKYRGLFKGEDLSPEELDKKIMEESKVIVLGEVEEDL